MTSVYNVLFIFAAAVISAIADVIGFLGIFNAIKIAGDSTTLYFGALMAMGVITVGQMIQYLSPSRTESLWLQTGNKNVRYVIFSKDLRRNVILSPAYGIRFCWGFFKDCGKKRSIAFTLLVGLLLIPVALFGIPMAAVGIIALSIYTAIAYCVTYPFVAAVRGSDKIYYAHRIKKIVCSDCGQICNDYKFVCPDCGTVFKDMEPGQYGVVSRTCITCGKVLTMDPTVKFRAYDLISDDCGHRFNTNSSEPAVIPMIGNPGCGKTSYLKALSASLIISNPDMKPINDGPLGHRSNSQTDKFPPLIMEYSGKKSNNPLRLFFYEINRDKRRIDSYSNDLSPFSYSDGILLFLDGTKIESNNTHGIKETEDMFESFITGFLSFTQTKNDEKSDIPIAVIINKNDSMTDHVTNQNAESYLLNSELISMVNNIKIQFEHYKFFACNDRDIDSVVTPIKWITSFEWEQFSESLGKRSY